MNDLLLTGMLTYGAPLFAATLFVAALGVPLPASLLVIAAGAFARQGLMPWTTASLVGLLGVVLGDSLSFGMGYFAYPYMTRRFAGSARWHSAQAAFLGRGGLAILSTRFLLTALAVPTNLIAGGSGYRFRRFLVYDLIGEAIWILGYGGLGYAFGTEWENISQFVSDSGGLLLGLVTASAGIWLALRRKRPEAHPHRRRLGLGESSQR